MWSWLRYLQPNVESVITAGDHVLLNVCKVNLPHSSNNLSRLTLISSKPKVRDCKLDDWTSGLVVNAIQRGCKCVHCRHGMMCHVLTLICISCHDAVLGTAILTMISRRRYCANSVHVFFYVGYRRA